MTAMSGEIMPARHQIPKPVVGDPHQVEELLQAWLVEYTSANTRAAYRSDVDRWLAYCAASDLDPLGPMTRTHVAAWLTALAEHHGEKPATRARRLAAVSALYGWLVAEEHIARNPAAHLERARKPQWPKRSSLPSLSREQASALLAAADAYTGPSGQRAAVIVAVLLYGGVRVSELTGATTDRLLHVRGHRVLRVIGKGEDEHDVVLPPVVTRRLDAYLAGRADVAATRLPARPGEKAPTVPVVATATGRALDRGAVWRLLRSLAKRAGIPVKMSPHVLRATCATLGRDAGAALEDIQEQLGHKAIATTRRYDRAAQRLDRAPAYSLAAFIPTDHDEQDTAGQPSNEMIRKEEETMEPIIGDLGTWTQAETDQYNRAKDAIRALISAYSGRIAVSDDATAEALSAERTRHAQQLRALSARDSDAVAAVIRDYPALIKQVRAGGPTA